MNLKKRIENCRKLDKRVYHAAALQSCPSQWSLSLSMLVNESTPAVSLNRLCLGNDGVGEGAGPAEEVDWKPVAVVLGHVRCEQVRDKLLECRRCVVN